MPLQFNTVYRISSHGDGGSTPPFIGVGTRVRMYPLRNVLVPMVQFRVNSPYFEGKQFLAGRFTDEDGGVVDIEDLAAAERGKKRFYRFEPLTLQRWAEMASDVVGFTTLSYDIATDDDLQNYYRSDYLDDWWENRTGDTLEEAAAFPTGTVRPRADGWDWQKMPNGDWHRIRPTFATRHYEPEPDEHVDSDAAEASDWAEEEIPPGGTWKEKASGLPHNTWEKFYKPNPLWPGSDHVEVSPERIGVYKDVQRRLFRGKRSVEEGRRPTAILTMGVPASGKSSAVRNVVADRNNFVHVDPDQIKSLLPEFQEAKAQRAKDAASIVHWESGWLAEQMRDEAVAKRMNLIFDGVGRDPEYYKDMIHMLKHTGYHVRLVMTHVDDADKAVARSNLRGEKFGRWVPEDRIRSAIPIVPQNFRDLRHEVDEFAVFDTNEFPPKLAWAKKDGHEVVPDAELKDRIVNGVDPAEPRKEQGPDVLPPDMTMDATIAAFLRAFEVDHALVELTPRRFTSSQGVTMPGDDAPPKTAI